MFRRQTTWQTATALILALTVAASTLASPIAHWAVAGGRCLAMPTALTPTKAALPCCGEFAPRAAMPACCCLPADDAALACHCQPQPQPMAPHSPGRELTSDSLKWTVSFSSAATDDAGLHVRHDPAIGHGPVTSQARSVQALLCVWRS